MKIATLDGLDHYPRRGKGGKFKKGKWRGNKPHTHKGHPSAKWRTVCGGKTKGWHRKKSAATKKAKSLGNRCRVARI